jgi:hypothetical protein
MAAGRDRIFYMTDHPTGWVHLERAGLAVRDPQDENRGTLTAAGRAFLGMALPTGSGRMDSRILQRQKDAILYDRRI